MEAGGNWRILRPRSTQKPHIGYIHRPVIHCWTLIYSGCKLGVTPVHQTSQNVCHDSTEFYRFRSVRPFRQQDPARHLRRPRRQMERHNARLTRTALFLFVATLGYMYYTSPDTPPPPQELSGKREHRSNSGTQVNHFRTTTPTSYQPTASCFRKIDILRNQEAGDSHFIRFHSMIDPHSERPQPPLPGFDKKSGSPPTTPPRRCLSPTQKAP